MWLQDKFVTIYSLISQQYLQNYLFTINITNLFKTGTDKIKHEQQYNQLIAIQTNPIVISQSLL